MSAVSIHSPEAELGALGCFLIDPTTIDEAIQRRVTSEWFYDARNSALFSELMAMREAKKHIDIITVQQHLSDAKLLESVGGLTALSGMIDSTPSASNLGYYIDILLKKLRHRKAIEAANSITQSLAEGQDPDEVLEKAEGSIMAVRSQDSGADSADAKALARAAISLLEDRCSGKTGAMSTGWSFFDRVTRGGLAPKKLYVFAGRPGDGKSALAASMVLNMASSFPVAFFSLEMGKEEVGFRMLAARSRVDVSQFDERIQPSQPQLKAMTVAAATNAKMNLEVIDTPKLTLNGIIARTRRLVRKKGIKIVFIDYLQLVESSEKKKERREVVDDISRGLKLMAKELDVAVVALAQLNREIEKEKARRPRMSDLRESGGIEQDADLIGILWRQPNPKKTESEQEDGPREVNLSIVKQRAGKSGFEVRFTFTPEITRFDAWSPITAEDTQP